MKLVIPPIIKALVTALADFVCVQSFLLKNALQGKQTWTIIHHAI